MTSARMTGADFDRIESYPLSWPTGHARTSELSRERARFGDHSMIEATRFVRHEFDLLPKARSLVVSSNVELRLDGNPRSNRRAPDDPGIAVYFVLGGEPHVLACDRWKLPEHNLWAIGMHVSAIRGQLRWGVGSVMQAFTGYRALPPATQKSPWWAVLGLSTCPAEFGTARLAYRNLAKQLHPDAGGDPEKFKALGAAMQEAEQHFAKAGAFA